MYIYFNVNSLMSIFFFPAKVCSTPESFGHKDMEIETNFTEGHLHFVGSQIVYVCTKPGESFKDGSPRKRISCVDWGETDYRWEYETITNPTDFECKGLLHVH